MDPWDPKLDKKPYTGRRLARVTIPNPDVVDVNALITRIGSAKKLARSLGQDLLLNRRQIKNPSYFVLSRAKIALPKPKRGATRVERCVSEGERLVIAAVILHEALGEFEAFTGAAQEAGWVRNDEVRDYRRGARGALRTMVQNLLTRAWARLPLELRHATMQAFSSKPGAEALWRGICRGSLSVAYVARAFQGLRIMKRRKRSVAVLSKCTASATPPAEAVCQSAKQEACRTVIEGCAPLDSTVSPKLKAEKPVKAKKKYWHVYAPTDKQDRWGKIDLVARGRVRGVGEVVLCINVKTGADHYLTVLHDPSDTEDVPLQRDQLDAFLEGVETFRMEHPQIARGKVKLFPVVIQTGGAVSGVTHMATNTKAIRELVKAMLRTFAKELKAKRKRERDEREIDEPGLSTRRQKRTPIAPKT